MNQRWQDFMTTLGAEFSAGRIARFNTGAHAQPAGAHLVDLSHYGVIRANGADARAFLHGQLTNDLLALDDGHAQTSGWCSAKGRLLALLRIWPGADGLCLLLPRALLGSIQKRLQMYVLRSKVVLSDESSSRVRFGLAGTAAEQLIRAEFGGLAPAPFEVHVGETATRIGVSTQRFLIDAEPDAALRLWQALTAVGACASGADHWDLHAIGDGIPEILPLTQDAFVPQMVNLDLLHAVNFHKGCYPGQEIVARTQYRGILKRRMARFRVACAVATGDPLFAAEFGDQPAGMVVMAAPATGGGHEALICAQIESIRAGSLRTADGNIPQRLPLPYPIPELD